MARRKNRDNNDNAASSGAAEKRSGEVRDTIRRWPRWLKCVLTLSIVLTIAGAGMWAYATVAGPGARAPGDSTASPGDASTGGDSVDRRGAGGASSSLLDPDGFLPNNGAGGGIDNGSDTRTGSGTESTTDDARANRRSKPDDGAMKRWSPTIFRLGFSFFLGFALAFALKKFLKLAILLVGVIAFGLFGLQYVGVIEVDWRQLEGVYDHVMPWFRDQTADFMTFVTGYLPSAASATGGLALGFRHG